MMRPGVGISGFVVLMALFLCSSAAPGQVSAAEIDSLFARFVSVHDHGCAVLVIKDGQPVFRKGYGVADLRTLQLQKIGPETNFRLASLTKQFSAMAVMLLVLGSELHFEDRLTGSLPEFPPYRKALTIRQLRNATHGPLELSDM